MSSSSLTHDQARQYLLDGRDQLDRVEREALLAHLASCAACQSYSHELASLQTTLTRTLRTQWGRARPANDSMLRLKLRITARTRVQRLQSIAASLASVAALAAVIVLAVLTLNNANQTTPAAPPLPQPIAARGVTQSVTGTIGALTFPIAVGDRIRLVGFDLVDDQLVPGSAIDFTLHWQTQYAMPYGDILLVRVVDEQGNVVVQLDAVPTDGARPTSSWQPGETIIDRHQVMLPITTPPGQYALLVGLFNPSMLMQERTSLGGYTVPAATLHVRTIPNRLDVNLEKFAALLGYALETSEINPGAYLAVTLYWQARANTLDSYQSFVQLMPVGDDAAAPIVMSDSVPGGGTRPTPTWNWGETIPDQHLLRLPVVLPPGQYNLVAGLYDTKTSARLNTPAGDNVITVTQLTVK
jgi:hypothetical protein